MLNPNERKPLATVTGLCEQPLQWPLIGPRHRGEHPS